MHKPAAEEPVTSLHDLSAVDLIEGFKAGQFSPSEVLEDVLAHVAAWEPHIKALYAFDPDGARAVAKASTDRWQKGEPMGVLDGVPVTIKDNIGVAGWPMRRGSAMASDAAFAEDAPAAARLREAGTVFLGKTTMPEYGWKGVGDSPLSGITRNPWDLATGPGGSSAGAASCAAL
ncbi:amidase family protein, partial [Bradyrhizobium sp.]|uniref:amidase family protein n=1 Tax=Bradyrhizobium sp. TaxID=376 RepID=UPI002736B7B4